MHTIESYLHQVKIKFIQTKIESIKKILYIVVDGKIKTKNQKINLSAINPTFSQIVTAQSFVSSKELINIDNS